MMREIAKELHTATDAFSVISRGTQRPRILDMCAAPGGFLATALEMCPEAQVLAFTLPLAEGGHRVLLGRDSRVKFKFLDITMLAEDMDMGVGLANNEPCGKFLPRNIAPHYLFRLILCDGQVLRTQKRPECREQREACRLVSTQLALGLEHTEPGGTMIILLHKLEEWDTIMLLYTFRKFSTITLFKPKRFHAKRSSFYMVASDIHSRSPQATQAVAKWKEIWNDATFKGPEEYRDTTHADERDVAGVLDEFGPGLIELGNAIWPTQEKALTKAFLCNK
ncbi:hypothetical protein CCUS01_11275 [Colletotrichum cuscutae]|uniref:Ribosomal RNA methyltransferase FtsJ domain-containing protein n=1 Tax=Colletotrichum cuscutae TaxID=1209917 RepID=A0AAI9U7W6_9PEZI|nr:hypothetical protein CCUS01_11275 [Colletotrichum cuscutae]